MRLLAGHALAAPTRHLCHVTVTLVAWRYGNSCTPVTGGCVRCGCCRLLLEMWNMGKAASTNNQKNNWIAKGLRLCTDYKVRQHVLGRMPWQSAWNAVLDEHLSPIRDFVWY